jgi:hypothetical protein
MRDHGRNSLLRILAVQAGQAQQVFRVGPFPQPLAGQVEALLRPLILALPQMMRARVAAQAVTLSLMMTSLWVQERQKKLGLWPKDPRAG